MSEQSVATRMQALNRGFAGLVVTHPQYASGWTKMLKILNLGRDGAAPSGVMLFGESGTGKTTMTRQLACQGNEPCTGHQQRVIYAPLKGSTSLGSVYANILEWMGDPSPDSGSNPRKLQRLTAGLTAKKTDVLIIDEMQHLITKRFDCNANLREVTNALKSILDGGTTSLILAGLPEAKQLWENDAQLRRRLLPPIELKNFAANDRSAWQDVIKEMVTCCGQVAVGRPQTPLGELADRMMLAARGNISTASRIIKGAAFLAISLDEKALTIELLRQSCLENVATEDSDSQAFLLTLAQLPRALEEHFSRSNGDSTLAKRTPTMGQVLSVKGTL